MSASCGTLDAGFAEVLGACAPSVVRLGERAWRFPLAGDDGPKVTLRLDDDWLVLAAPLPDPMTPGTVWDGLRSNASTTGPARLTLPRHGRDAMLRADIPVDDGVDLASRVSQALLGMRHLAGFGGTVQHEAAAVRGGPREGQGDPADLPALLTEMGWSFVERSSRKLTIDLDVPGQFFRAVIDREDGGCRVGVELAAAAVVPERNRAALGVLLLTASGILRMVRAAVVEHDESAAVLFQADFVDAMSAAELKHVLAALSVACREAGRETRALLEDEELAETYLAARGWAE